MSQSPYSSHAFGDAARNLAATGRRLYRHGWSPATSSNYSLRLDPAHLAITRSGRDKGLLSEADIMVVDMQGKPVNDDGKPGGGYVDAHPRHANRTA